MILGLAAAVGRVARNTVAARQFGAGCVAVVVEVEVSQRLRRFPDVHPQVVGRSALFWLKPGDSRIHQTLSRLGSLNPLTGTLYAAKISCAGPSTVPRDKKRKHQCTVTVKRRC